MRLFLILISTYAYLLINMELSKILVRSRILKVILFACLCLKK